MNAQPVSPLNRLWQPHTLKRAVLLLILLTAVTVRLWQFDAVPPGLTHDEADHGHDAIAILHGARPLYQTVGYGREPLYDYYLAFCMALAGPTATTLRLASTLLGLLTLLLTWAWVREAFDGPTALITLAFQAASFWSLSTARQALRSGLMPVLLAAAAWVWWRAFRSRHTSTRHSLATTLLMALLIGATLYTYMPARLLWAVWPATLVHLALLHRSAFRRLWQPTLLAVLLGLLLALPMFAYLRAHPGAEQRLDMLDAPLDALRHGDPGPLLDNARAAIASLLLPGHGDDFLAYNLPGRPTLEPLTALLFLVGLIVGLARWRDPPYAFALLWLALGLAPTLVTGPNASTTRNIGLMPVLHLFPALAGSALIRWTRQRWGHRPAWGLTAGLTCLLVLTGMLAARDYLVTWGRSPHVRAAYQHTLTRMARYAQNLSSNAPVGISAYNPNIPHDPYIWDLYAPDRPQRWFDARHALLIPDTSAASLLAPAGVPLAPYFALPGLRPTVRVPLQPDDLDPHFDAYHWEPRVTLAALRQRAATDTTPAAPANLGDILVFLGYDLRTPTPPPGGDVELATLWRVLAPTDKDLVLFTHALDASGQVVGQQDRLDAPAWDWQPGDTVVQIHRFALPADLPPGSYALEIGLYTRAPGYPRLPVYADGVAVSDHIRLPNIEVTAP